MRTDFEAFQILEREGQLPTIVEELTTGDEGGGAGGAAKESGAKARLRSFAAQDGGACRRLSLPSQNAWLTRKSSTPRCYKDLLKTWRSPSTIAPSAPAATLRSNKPSVADFAGSNQGPFRTFGSRSRMMRSAGLKPEGMPHEVTARPRSSPLRR